MQSERLTDDDILKFTENMGDETLIVTKGCYDLFYQRLPKDKSIPKHDQLKMLSWFIAGFNEAIIIVENKIHPFNIFENKELCNEN